MKISFENVPARADESRGIPVDYASGQRNIPVWRWNLVVVLLASPVIYFAARALLDRVWISAPGAVELKRISLQAGQGGQIVFLTAADERVAAGATLAIIRPVSGAASLPEAAPATGRAPVAVERPGALAAAAQLLAYRRQRVANYRQLLAAGAATQAELAAALGPLWEAEEAYRRLHTEIEGQRQVQGKTPHELQGKTQRESQRKTPLPPLEEQVTAPFPGVVTQVRGHVGSWVAANADLITLVDDREAKIVAYLDARRLRYAQPGRGARVEFRDGTSLPARVVEVKLETAPVPVEHLGALESSINALQVVLAMNQPLPEAYRKHHLPVTVRFDLAGP